MARTDWVVYCKAPFGGPAQVLKDLSRYTHRVAISNRRLLFVGDGVVRFSHHDYVGHYQLKEMTLPATEFLRGFLLHVVPPGFMRIRHWGVTANCRRQQKLARCRELLGQPAPSSAAESAPAAAPAPPVDTDDAAALRCPACGGRMRVIEILAPTPAGDDTS
jgi:hypothetical protein